MPRDESHMRQKCARVSARSYVDEISVKGERYAPAMMKALNG